MNNEPIVIERTYNAPVSKVWKAITDRNDMRQWYFDLKEFKPEKGFEFEFEAGPDESSKYLHRCIITDVEEGKKLAYTWEYPGYAGKSLVTFELFDEGDRTRVKLTHSGLETFPADKPDFKKENFTEGWTSIMDKSLKDFVEKV
jgi:uncharacterized protein YndB with AHSA1/START domain